MVEECVNPKHVVVIILWRCFSRTSFKNPGIQRGGCSSRTCWVSTLGIAKWLVNDLLLSCVQPCWHLAGFLSAYSRSAAQSSMGDDDLPELDAESKQNAHGFVWKRGTQQSHSSSSFSEVDYGANVGHPSFLDNLAWNKFSCFVTETYFEFWSLSSWNRAGKSCS